MSWFKRKPRKNPPLPNKPSYPIPPEPLKENKDPKK